MKSKKLIQKRWGTVLRCYDNRGRSADRYTILPPRWADDYRDGALWAGIAASSEPFHPQGFGQTCYAMPGPHLGRRVHWSNLPVDVRRFAAQTFPQFATEE